MKYIIYLFILLTLFTVNSYSFFHISFSNFLSTDEELHWIFRLVPILIGYGILILIGFYLIRWVERKFKENDHFFHQNILLRFLRFFALGHPEYQQIDVLPIKSNNLLPLQILNKKQKKSTFSFKRRRKYFFEDLIYFLIYFLGIQFCLIVMGFYQEKIITQPYKIINDKNMVKDGEFFKDAQFLVFANRLVALILSGIYILINWKSLPIHVPPFYLHSFTSFSNILSSWCQYEALKYVNFPTQTVCKASKLIPTMIMGRIIRKCQYTMREYILAFIVVFGASLFFLSSSSQIKKLQFNNIIINKENNNNSLISGLLLMFGYLFFDSFTPNWQKKIFEKPPCLNICQMMFSINLFSVIFCLISLLQQSTLFNSINFIFNHENIFFFDCLFLSLGSAFGQIFILMTVKRFGPVVLSLLMTIRQILSIFLSTFHFGHSINFFGFLGLFIVFTAIITNIYAKYRINRIK
ncbi:hypothetical protein Mgra_00002170 [Meloidogyne graminicola]|uniref:Adenosine 3'-phospho 5'-phosphosulfate transporter 1 n=1 Tax=Meloidogyne graminicola TaxID=189291 RepID=A0A8S9ZYU3_9BILA|nr:hypothetical protein Mgra_00002170 [Meloidogyne graminicola]